MKATLFPTVVGLAILQGYADGWVSDFPNEIAGYTVLYIRTPRTQACSDTSILELVASPGAEPVFEDARSMANDLEDFIPIPGGVTINIEPAETTRVELGEAVRIWNRSAQSPGCDGVGWSAGRLKLPDGS